jgi:hypothetical protein
MKNNEKAPVLETRNPRSYPRKEEGFVCSSPLIMADIISHYSLR